MTEAAETADREIRALVPMWLEADRCKDTKATAGFYAAERHFMVPNPPNVEGQATTSMWTNLLSVPGDSLTFGRTRIDASAEGDSSVSITERTRRHTTGKRAGISLQIAFAGVLLMGAVQCRAQTKSGAETGVNPALGIALDSAASMVSPVPTTPVAGAAPENIQNGISGIYRQGQANCGVKNVNECAQLSRLNDQMLSAQR